MLQTLTSDIVLKCEMKIHEVELKSETVFLENLKHLPGNTNIACFTHPDLVLCYMFLKYFPKIGRTE